MKGGPMAIDMLRGCILRIEIFWSTEISALATKRGMPMATLRLIHRALRHLAR